MFVDRYGPLGWILTAIKGTVDWVLPGALWSWERLVAFTFHILTAGFLAYAIAARRLTASAADSATNSAIPRREYLPWILVPLAVFQITLIFVPGTMTTDIYNYAIYGEMPVLYGANPFLHTPSEFPQSPLYYLIPLYWHEAASVYGPFWVSLSAGLASLTRNSALADELLAYRVIANIAHFGNAVLVWAIARRLNAERAGSATVAYAWNPLLLLEFALNGHNDVLMLTFALAAILVGTYRRLTATAIALGLSVATKYTSVLIAGPLLFAVARAAPGDLWAVLRRAVLAAAAMTAVVIGAYAIWFEGPETFGPAWYWMSGPRSNNFWPDPVIAAVAGWVAGGLHLSYDEGWNHTMAGFKLVAKVVLVVWVAVETLRVRNVQDALAASARIALVFLLLVNTWLMPWYYTWPLAFCAALGWERTIVRVCAGFTLTALYAMYQHQYGASLVHEMAGLFLILPLVLAAGPSAFRWLRAALGRPTHNDAPPVTRRDTAPV
jgi:Gpi18-like mannosyltransferase